MADAPAANLRFTIYDLREPLKGKGHVGEGLKGRKDVAAEAMAMGGGVVIETAAVAK